MRSYAAAVTCLALCVASASAGITDYAIANDGDGAINCVVDSWADEGAETYSMTIVGDQFWGPGHMVGEFTVDNDPTVRVRNIIDNETSSAWIGYRVNVFLANPFMVSTAPADLLVYGPTDWTATLTQSATWNGTAYQAIIDYTGGTPIAVGETLDFGYKFIFQGTVQYCQEMIPISLAIPEPATMSLLAIGGLAALLRRKRS
ncbi:MAG: PEP-CTERM sorting domain-containing protein [Planctomycetaceae bacterium]|nr:PEP-CTERM sorting domain-containing protein [Planctomycetaceae bacterium]